MNSFLLEKSAYYYFAMLNESEKNLYRSFLYALLNMEEKAEIKGSFSSDQVEKITRYIINDRPDIFWYRGKASLYSRDNALVMIKFHYVYPKEQKNAIIRDMENSSIYRLIDSKLKSCANDFDKALQLYELIIKNTEYDTAAVINDSNYYDYAYGMNGVILKHRAVCNGYAKTFQYFMNRHNVNCTLVTGVAKNERHAWNLINLYGSYYYIDSTWGDPVFLNTANKDPGYISYKYFCITTYELQESHRPVFDAPMPLCTATKYNYYEYFGIKEASYSMENIASRIVNAVKKGEKKVLVKYSTQAAYQSAVAGLFKRSEVFDALKLASRYVISRVPEKIKYNLNDEERIITINL